MYQTLPIRAEALLHGGELFIPYGVSDYATRFATVQLDEVLAAMQ